MSHELRTPLNSIIGFSELLEDQAFGALNDKQRRHVANILASGRHLLRLINDILDLSKVEAGRMQLAPSTFDVEIALEEARAIVASLAGAKHQNLTVRCEDSLPPLTADQPKFKQILYNLIGNAIKYTPEHGTVTVTARATPPENGGGPLLEVAVSDTGIGLEPKDQERIFEEFEQVDSRYVREQQGTGLGLALTRKLVQLHGGRIWVESELGVGSAFRFVLPFGQAAPVESRPTPGDARRSDRGSGPLVLVVEDYGPVGNLLAHYLAQSGYSVARAASAGEAIELARKLRPSAITLDMLLPDRDGMELLAQLKAEPETRDIPVVVVSVAENRDLGLGIGAAEWLVKPVDQVRLASALQRALAAAEPTTRPTEVVR
jgi:CheY-like chemotaxis protein